MKLKHLISTSALVLAGIQTANAVDIKYFSCTACPAGKYSKGGSVTSCTTCPAGTYSSTVASKSCTPCPAGTYSSAGATSCSACASSTYSSWGGNCGSVTRTRTDYCTATGSTSSTANPKTVTENGNKGNTCGVGSYCPSGTNKNCTACTNKPDGSYYTTNCSWACSGSLTAKDGKCGCNYTYLQRALNGGLSEKKSGWLEYGLSKTISTTSSEPLNCTTYCTPSGYALTEVNITYSSGTKTIRSGISNKSDSSGQHTYSYTFTCQ